MPDEDDVSALQFRRVDPGAYVNDRSRFDTRLHFIAADGRRVFPKCMQDKTETKCSRNANGHSEDDRIPRNAFLLVRDEITVTEHVPESRSSALRSSGMLFLLSWGGSVLTLARLASYSYIDRQADLDRFLDAAAQSPSIAVDTESSSFYTYVSDLCLLQMSASGSHALVDTLAPLDLSRIAALFKNPGVLKIFHAAQGDLGEMRRKFGWEVKHIFDTMIAARLVGIEACSLANLVDRYEGVKLEKKEQKSDWRKRPLSKSQLDYAHLDTLYLESIMGKLKAELEQFGMMEEAQSEFEWVTRPIEEPEVEKTAAPDAWMKLDGAKDLSPRGRGILKNLHEWRDRTARRENLAVFRIATNDSIMRIARRAPRSERELRELRGLSPVLDSSDYRDLVACVSSARDEPFRYKERPVIDPNQGILFRELKAWRQKVAEYRGLDPALIVSNRVLSQIADKRPADTRAVEAMGLMTEWKIRHYASFLVEVANGRSPSTMPDVAVLPVERRRVAAAAPAR